MSSIDGLVSGMKTTEMISQLMQIEALPQSALKNKVTAQNKAVTSYQSVNTKMAAVLTAAKALGTADTWGPMKATSSSDAAVVTAKPGAAAGSLSFTVSNLATTHTVTFKNGSVGALTDPVLTGGSLTVKRTDGSSVPVTPASASLQDVVKSINDTPNAAYRAAAVQVSPGQYTLQLTALGTGATAAFAGAPAEIDLLGLAAITTQGADAKIMMGSTTPYAITSATNTFADVLPGVSVTLTRAQAAGDPAITVGLAADKDAVAAKAQALVDATNAALTEIAALTKAKVGNVPGGPLTGDATLRKISQDLLGAVSSGGGAVLGTYSQVGIKLERDGKLSFDKTKFLDALTADPAKTRSYFDSYTDVAHAKATTAFEPGWDTANGLARKLETLGVMTTEGVILPSDPVGTVKEGVLPGLIKRRNESIGQLNKQVAGWDTRLAVRETALKRQWSSLEVSLSKLQSQSSWLSGQLAGLPR